MKTLNDIFDQITEAFGEEDFELSEQDAGDSWITVMPHRIHDVAKYLRDEQGLRFDSLMCLSGVHYSKEEMLGVTYHLYSTEFRHRLTIKVIMPQDDARLPSVEQIWKTADWHEREAYDMLGIVFEGHPDMRRILCPDDWEGHPLRKDYKEQEQYQNMKVPY